MSVNRTVENVYMRQEAAQLTRRHFWPLLGMTLIINFIQNWLDKGLTAIGDQLMGPEIETFTTQYNHLLTSGKITSSQPLLQAFEDLLFSPKFLLFNLLFIILTSLVSTGLHLGRRQQLIDTAQGGIPQIRGVFRMVRYCLKAWAVDVWGWLKAILWMLPGAGVMIVGGELMLYGWAELSNAVLIIGMGLMCGLFIPALLRYALSAYILADDPHRGVRECVNCSVGLMNDRKWQFFKLGVPVLLKAMLASLAAELIGTLLFSAVNLDYTVITYIETLLAWAATIYFVLQLDMLCALFYLHRRDKREPQEDGSPKPVSYWLRESPTPEPPVESTTDSPLDASSETHENTKENDHEEPDR